jgi:AraC-like DNA-binding protein
MAPSATVNTAGFNDRIYPIGLIATVVDSLVQEGITERKALEAVHLSSRGLRSYRTRVSVSQLIQICRNASRLSRDPHFGYHAGQRCHFSTFGLYGFAILSSTNFREGVRFATRYQKLVLPLVNISFREEYGHGIWTFLPIAHPRIDSELSRFLIESHLSLTISVHRDGMGPSFAPLQILLQLDRPQDAEIYPRMFGCPVLFNQNENRLIFNAAWLDREPSFGNEIAHQETMRLCDELLEQLQLRVGIAGRVREVLLAHHLAPMTCAAAAKHLHMAERTLRRKLREEHISFRKLVYELRMQMAVKYLRDTDLTIQEIGHSLGFSEDASFRRAFRRYAEKPPTQFRHRLKNGIPHRLHAA